MIVCAVDVPVVLVKVVAKPSQLLLFVKPGAGMGLIVTVLTALKLQVNPGSGRLNSVSVTLNVPGVENTCEVF